MIPVGKRLRFPNPSAVWQFALLSDIFLHAFAMAGPIKYVVFCAEICYNGGNVVNYTEAQKHIPSAVAEFRGEASRNRLGR